MERREKIIGMLLAAPVILGLLVFIIVPLAITVYYSFTFGTGGAEFVWFSNYTKVYRSELFQLAAGNTAKFLLAGIPFILLLSLFLAILLDKAFAGSKLFRLAFLFPMLVSVASTVMAAQIFLAQKGAANAFLITLGLPVQNWLNTPWAFVVLLLLFLWKNTGYNIILILAGLQMIPKEYYQVAELDGARKCQQFRFITLPMLQSTLFFTFVISILNAFKSFREAFLIGGTHPHESIYLLQHFMNNNFENLNYPRLSVAALSVFSILFLIISVLYVIQLRAEKRGGIHG